MQVSASPSPFYAATGFQIAVTGGEPPYSFATAASPPNPPGLQVTITSQGPPAQVAVPASTPAGTTAYVVVTDSSSPPQVVTVGNVVRR